MDANIQWFAAGNAGCTFLTVLCKNPQAIAWHRTVNPTRLHIPKDAYIFSALFPQDNMQSVLDWALSNGFYLEKNDNETCGLRYDIGETVCWVQYFGPDSHVKTRQAPIPELCFTVVKGIETFYKVGFKGVLHLAHAGIQAMWSSFSKEKRDARLDQYWKSAHTATEKILGYKPTIKEAAKTTYLNSQIRV